MGNPERLREILGNPGLLVTENLGQLGHLGLIYENQAKCGATGAAWYDGG